MLKLIFTLLIFYSFETTGFGQANKSRPNILFILTDDQTFGAIGYNNGIVQTPHLDALAKNGIIFDRMIAASPICVASRASLLTGLYPQQNGTVALDSKSFIAKIATDKKFPTFLPYLHEAGYLCYFAGKSHLGLPHNYGFDYGEESTDYTDSVSCSQVLQFISDSSFGSKPFFIWLALRQPHLPLKPQPQWLNLYANVDIPVPANFLEQPPALSFFNQGLPGEHFYRDGDYTDNYKNLPAGPPRTVSVIKEFTKAYYACISHLDAQVGTIIQQLRKAGKLNNTLIVFLSDNGYFLGNHGLGNKITMHEESVRVPFFISGERLSSKNRHYVDLTGSLDIFPTILDLAGVKIPGYLPGKSLKKILNGSSEPLHDALISECVGVGGTTGTGHRMVRTKYWKYILSDQQEEALFDLRKDPYEMNNVIAEKKHGAVAQALREKLNAWKKMVGDRKPTAQ